MKLTKFTHSCVRIEDDNDRLLVIDPGVFSEAGAALTGAHAVLITHQHADHLDPEALVAAARAEPALHLWVPADVAPQLDQHQELAERYTVVGAAQSFVAGGLQVRTYGGQHALIHPSLAMVANVGYLVGDAVYHPGDSLIVPNATVETVLLPIHAPWSKTAEVIDFAVSVRAERAFPIHDALLSELGRSLTERLLSGALSGHRLAYEHVEPGTELLL
jgi:L-ascorbate metabolism protein UlaG (beta-lactamase superfamily)